MDFPEYASQAVYGGAAKGLPYAAAAGRMAYNYWNARNAQQIKKNRKLIRWNQGETKCMQHTINVSCNNDDVNVTYLTNIIQGDDHDQRIGRRIRVMGYRYQLHAENRLLDVYIIRSKDNTGIGLSGFDTPQDGGINWDEHNEWRVIENCRTSKSTTLHYRGGKRFKGGRLIHYTGVAATDVAGPAYHLVCKNVSGVALTLTGTVYVYYKDA